MASEIDCIRLHCAEMPSWALGDLQRHVAGAVAFGSTSRASTVPTLGIPEVGDGDAFSIDVQSIFMIHRTITDITGGYWGSLWCLKI